MNFSPAAFVKSYVPPPGHQRTYVLSYFIAMIGNGIFLPIFVLYCTHIVHIPYAETGLASTIAGLLAFPLTLFAGDLADRLGPRRVVLFGLAGQLAGMGSYVFVQGFWSLLAILAGMNIFAFSYFASVGALMRRIAGDDTVEFRSRVETFRAMGIVIGAAAAGVGITIGTRNAYHVMFVAVAVLYLICISITFRIPDYKPLPRPESTEQAAEAGDGQPKVSRWIVLRDKPFIAYAVVASGLAMCTFVVDLLIPVWIVVYTHAPRWTVTAVYIINTGMMILLMMRLAQRVKTVRQGGSSMRRAGAGLLVGYLLLAEMKGHSAWLAVILLLAGAALLALAQIWLIAGQFVLEFTLPPAYAQGQYDGLLTMVGILAMTAAPVVLIGLVLSHGFAGWLGLGAFFLALGLISPAIAAWGERTRPKADTTAEATEEPGGADAVAA